MPAAKFEALANVSPETKELWGKIGERLYEGTSEGELHMGYPDAGHVSTYYPDSADITKEEIATVSDFLESKKLLPENTRLRKTGEGFEVLIASASTNPSAEERDLNESEWTLEGKLAGKKVKLVFGDHFIEMGKIADAISKAGRYAANPTEEKMMGEYEKSFASGSLEAYKESQRHWIQDLGPAVETDIGFVEVSRNLYPISYGPVINVDPYRHTATRMAFAANGKASWQWSTKSERPLLGSWSNPLPN